jgi:hypothetical protein
MSYNEKRLPQECLPADQGYTDKNPSSAQKILKQMETLTEHSTAINKQMGDKLGPICLPEKVCEKNPETPRADMPEYFAEMQSHIITIGRNLEQIRETLKRVDI